MIRTKVIFTIVFLLMSSMLVQANDQLIQGIDNMYLLMLCLGVGILVLLICLLTSMYLLSKLLPMLIKKQQD